MTASLDLNKKNNIVVEIKGGFGNQIFQFIFANYLKEKGFRVKVNTRFYNQFEKKNTKIDTFRQLILGEEFFDFKNISYFYFKFLRLNKKINESRKIKKILKEVKNPIYIKLKDSNFSAELLNKKFIHLDGYWQNIDYLISEKEFLYKSLSKNKILENSFQNPRIENSTMLIVRRGDYVDIDEDLGLDFYKNSIDYLKSNIGEFHLEIFTDDVKWVKSKNIFSDAKNIYGPEEMPLKVIDLFGRMINNQHFIIGNSTFSLMAAFLGEKEDSIVLVADPWFRKRDYGNLTKDNWVKIKNV
tara:strand:- start:510 stop:1406 length:897 start_codon:yes stop_codon:yes gene_type:complete